MSKPSDEAIEIFETSFHEGHDFVALSAAFRDAGMDLAVEASRVVESITRPPGLDGIHRLSLAIARWYQTVADERHI
jgi:hypothetical protein